MSAICKLCAMCVFSVINSGGNGQKSLGVGGGELFDDLSDIFNYKTLYNL